MACCQSEWHTITWTNADILSIWLLRTNFSEIWVKIQKILLNMLSAKWRPFCFNLNVSTAVRRCASGLWNSLARLV